MASDPAKSMDVAARVVDLVGVVMNPAGITAAIGKEVIRWLGRNSISDTSFTRVMTVGKGIAYPNLHGIQVLCGLDHTAGYLRDLRGVNLVTAGAFGRAVLQDPELRWMATTEAVILRYHDLKYATQALCDLLIDATDEQKDLPLMTALVQPIIQEAVHSIALHTTNSAPNLAELPKELQRLGHHVMTANALFGAISATRKITSDDISIHMQYCATDLMNWIYHHWSGRLLVVSNNEKVYDEDLMHATHTAKRVLTVFIDKGCTAKRCHDVNHSQGSISIGTTHNPTSNGAPFDPSFKTDGISQAHLPNTSAGRSKLYEIADRNPYVKYYLTISQKEDVKAQTTALEVVRSIMALYVAPGSDMTLRIESPPVKDSRTFQWWAVCAPSLLQQDNLLPEDASIRRIYWPGRPFEEKFELKGMNPHKIPSVQKQAEMRARGYYRLSAICKLYPEILDAMAMARQRCQCGCRTTLLSSDVDDNADGCRQTLMAAQVLLYISHALAEAAGAEDVSNVHGTSSAKGLINATMELLGTIAVDGYIDWVLWFRLAASAITGLHQDIWAKRYRWDTQNLSGEMPMFVVSGSMTVVPTWFDLDREVDLRHSWGVKTLAGSVRGVIDEVALVQAQPTSRSAGPFSPDILSVTFGYIDHDDHIDIQAHVWRVDDFIYRHATSAQAGRGARILSPFDIYSGYMLAKRPTCPHDEDETTEAYVWSIKDILGFGQDVGQQGTSTLILPWLRTQH